MSARGSHLSGDPVKIRLRPTRHHDISSGLGKFQGHAPPHTGATTGNKSDLPLQGETGQRRGSTKPLFAPPSGRTPPPTAAGAHRWGAQERSQELRARAAGAKMPFDFPILCLHGGTSSEDSDGDEHPCIPEGRCLIKALG